MPSPPDPTPRSSDPFAGWAGLFHQATEPIFLLNRQRRVRFVNKAWEQLTGHTAESVLGLFCLPRKRRGLPTLQTLAQTLAPPPEVRSGAGATVRRPIPGARVGPPWWDISFFPLTGPQGLLGILGRILRVGEGKPISTGGRGFAEPLIRVRQQVLARYTFDLLASSNPRMDRLAAQARAAAHNRNPVWIAGEPGTGKETLARIIHFQGETREKTFLKLDCVGLQPFLVRSVLFGQNGLAESGKLGTIFLKEPAALNTETQSLLLDWYLDQDRPPRVIAASRETPEDLIRSEKLLTDFWSVLCVQELRLLPLRERLDDLPRLTARLQTRPIAAEVFQGFEVYPWPGNLRELREILSEAAQVDAPRIEWSHLSQAFRDAVRLARGLPPRPHSELPPLPLETILHQTERKLIELALRRTHGNKTEAAEILGLNRTQLWRRLKDHGLEAD